MVDDENFIEVCKRDARLPRTMRAILEMPDGLDRVRDAAANGKPDGRLDKLKSLPIVTDPHAIRALEHVASYSCYNEGSVRAYRLFESAAGDDAVRLQIVGGNVSDRCTEAWAQGIVAHSRSHSREAAFGAYLHSWAREDFSSSVCGLSTPWLVLIGEHDPALGPQLMRETFLKSFPVALLETIGNCGHYPMWEAPVATGTRIQSYLRLHAGKAIT